MYLGRVFPIVYPELVFLVAELFSNLVVDFLQQHMIPKRAKPLLVLVNVKSGGQEGMELIRSFRKLLNPHQVYDLMNGGPLPG